jgi:hypothetical protein
MFNSTIDMIKRYAKFIVPVVVFNLVLAFIICLVRGVLTVIDYSNTLLAIGGLTAGLGLLSFLGNINSKGDIRQQQTRSLVYENQEKSSEDHLDSEKKSINFLMIAAIAGIITILLSGLVLNFR